MCCWFLLLLGLWLAYKLLDIVWCQSRVRKPSQLDVFITGCDTGFGHLLAKRLDSLGCRVFAGCLTDHGQTELLQACSDRLVALSLDVRSADSVRRAYEIVRNKLPADKGLWAVVNNAGIIGSVGREEWLTIDDYKQAMNVNLFGMIDVTMTFLPLIKQSRGRVINMSSVAGFFSLSPFLPYTVSKHGVEAFTDALRRSLHQYGCKAVMVEPGFFRTNIVSIENTRSSMTATWNQASTDIQAEFGDEYMEHAIRDIQNFEKMHSSRLTDVVDAYEQAVFARHPRARYLVGRDAKFLWWPIIQLPEWIGDWVLRSMNQDPAIPAVLRGRRR